MATLTPQASDIDGITITMAAASGIDKVTNTSGRTILVVTNGDASSKTVTVAAQTTTRPAQGAFPEQTVGNISTVIAAGATAIIGPFTSCYNNTSGELVVSFSATTSVTIGAVEIN